MNKVNDSIIANNHSSIKNAKIDKSVKIKNINPKCFFIGFFSGIISSLIANFIYSFFSK